MKIVEVAMEIAFPTDFLERIQKNHGHRAAQEAGMSTSVGGIGPLLRERILDQADQGIEVVGITLLYDTVWVQNWFDWGQLHLRKHHVGRFLRPRLEDTGITLSLPLYSGETLQVKVWKVAYGKGVVYFLDVPPYTNVVYPSSEDAPANTPDANAWSEEIRLQHSWILGRGSLALIKQLNFSADILIMSETPTLFAHHRIVKDEWTADPFFKNLKYIFNDHTPLEYAHPIWPLSLAEKVKLDTSLYEPIKGNTKPEIDVTRLLIGLCEGVFGVSEKHKGVMQAMPSLKDYAAKIDGITNGVHLQTWQDPVYAKPGLSNSELLECKKNQKHLLLDWIWRQYRLWPNWKSQAENRALAVWLRRITGYKRLDVVWGFLKNPELRERFIQSDTTLLIGGRIHQHDDQAQRLVYNLLDHLSTDPAAAERIIFIDNYNIFDAPRFFHGTEASIMLADDGREAAATGFMKAQMNANLIIACSDGAVPESVTFANGSSQNANGFEVPYVQGQPTAEGLVLALEALHQTLKDPARYVAMMRSALASTQQVDVARTVRDTAVFYQKLLK